MPRRKIPTDLRDLSDTELSARQQDLSRLIFQKRFEHSLSSQGFNSAALNAHKKDRARILTIQRERQLALGGFLSAPSIQKWINEPAARDAKEKRSSSGGDRASLELAPVVAAKLLGSEYPVVVGRQYTIVLQREKQGNVEIQQALFGERILAPRRNDRVFRRGTAGRIDLDVSVRSETIAVNSDNANYVMKKFSNLEIKIVPKEAGPSILEIFVSVSVSKQLLQIIQVPLTAIHHVLEGDPKRSFGEGFQALLNVSPRKETA